MGPFYLELHCFHFHNTQSCIGWRYGTFLDMHLPIQLYRIDECMLVKIAYHKVALEINLFPKFFYYVFLKLLSKTTTLYNWVHWANSCRRFTHFPSKIGDKQRRHTYFSQLDRPHMDFGTTLFESGFTWGAYKSKTHWNITF